MTTEEKKIDLIGKIINLENDKIIDMVNELLEWYKRRSWVKKGRLGKRDG
jgi:uncharacterized protein (DUF3820 family)